MKGLRNIKMVDIDDNSAFEASRLYLSMRKHSISLVDSFVLAIAKKERAKVFTSDHKLRNAARDIKVEVNYLPRESLSQQTLTF